MNKYFEVMGILIYFGYIHLVEGGYQDLKAFEKDKNIKDVFKKLYGNELYKNVQMPKLASRSYLALRGCYRKKKLDPEEVYKKLKLVANKIGTEHLEYCINSTITVYYPDKRVPKNAFKEITYINERLGINADFTYKHLALEDLTAVDKIKEKAKNQAEVNNVKVGGLNRSFKEVLIFTFIVVVILGLIYYFLK